MWLVAVLNIVSFCLVEWGMCAVQSGVLVKYTKPGDFIVGGIFPLHEDDTCQGGLRNYMLENVEMMVFALKEINSNDNILPNITLGFDIRESCYMEDASLWSTLSILSEHIPEGLNAAARGNTSRSNLIGVIGTRRSTTSVLSAKATNLYDVPMISGFASSDELSDKTRFPYFLRTTPPDKLQAMAIIDTLLQFNWLYIGVMYSADTYGMRGTQELLNLADENGICVAFSIAVRETYTESDIKDAVSKLLEYDNAKVYVMFGGYKGMFRILLEFHNIKPTQKLTLIGSDSFKYSDEYGVQNFTMGNLFFTPDSHEVPGFDKYFNDMVASISDGNPWFAEYKEFWLTQLGCVDINQCHITTTNLSSTVYHAVYVFAYALDDMMRDRCITPFTMQDCELFRGISGVEFLPFLLNVTFQGIDGLFRFDENGDPEGTYQVNSFRNGGYYRVGNWDSHRSNNQLSINTQDIIWPDGVGKPPFSLCSEDCQLGYIQVPLEKKCCRGCQKCASNAIVQNGMCVPCEERFWPNDNYGHCEKIQTSTFQLKNPIILIILVLSLVGVCMSLLSICGMAFYRNHPLIKATSRELSLISIFGTMLAFLTLFAFLPVPTATSCAASEAIISLCVTLTYAPTLLKVNRIFRIFEASKKSTKRPRFVRPKDQLILSAMLISLQVRILVLKTRLYNFDLDNFAQIKHRDLGGLNPLNVTSTVLEQRL